MTGSINYKFLTEEDIYELSDYIDNLKKSENNIVYINPYISIKDFNDISIREGFFNYLIMPFIEESSNKINRIAYYQLPRPESAIKAIELYLLAKSSQNEDLVFFKSSLSELKRLSQSYTKVKVPVEIKSNHDYMIGLLNDSGFKKELVLESEFEDNVNVAIYSYFF